jgi:polyhydroxyalkanoate synthesis regulator protein
LTQIIMDEEQRGETMLPVNFLRQLISMYGGSMQTMVPQYLEASMESFRRNHDQFREALTGAFKGGPFEALAKRNMAMFEAATKAFTENALAATKASEKANAGAAAPEAASDQDELQALKVQMQQLQERLEKLGK